jgi:hypothetical protein
MKRIALSLVAILALAGTVSAKPATHSASKPTVHQVPIGHMQTNPKAWNYGMIRLADGSWRVTPKSGWWTFLNNLFYFAGTYIPQAFVNGSEGLPPPPDGVQVSKVAKPQMSSTHGYCSSWNLCH